jgi:SAM-dependent methyltransferase/rubredoxin
VPQQPVPPQPAPPRPGTPFPVALESWSCAVCGLAEPRPYRTGMYAIGEVRFDLGRCPGCGLVYIEPRPDGPTLDRMYDDPDYYNGGYNLGVETENYFERKDELLAQYDGEVAQLEGEVGAPGALMELGSAGGFFIEAARRRGWRVQGVELSPPAARYSKQELGLEVFEGQLDQAPFPEAGFDVVVADNVLEHTTDPEQVLRDLNRLLVPGGHALIVVPTYVNSMYFRLILGIGRLLPRRLLGQSLLRLLKMDGDHDGGYPYHILEFDRRTLVRLVKQAGLEVVSVERSVPLPAHLFKKTDPNLVERGLRLVFRALNLGMAWGILPGARVRLLARRPRGAHLGG